VDTEWQKEQARINSSVSLLLQETTFCRPSVLIKYAPPPPTHTHTHNNPTSRLEINPTGKDQTPNGTTFTSYYINITWTIFMDCCINGLDALENGKSLPTALPTIKPRLLRRSTRTAVSKLLSYPDLMKRRIQNNLLLLQLSGVQTETYYVNH
jgi:hypothetical protein